MFKEDFVTIIRKYLQIIRFFANQEMVIRDGSLLLWLVSFVQILKTKSHAFNQFSRYNFNIYLPVWPHFICTGKSITYLTNHFTSLFCWLFRTFCLPLTLKYTGHSFNIFRGAVGQVVCHLITSTMPLMEWIYKNLWRIPQIKLQIWINFPSHLFKAGSLFTSRKMVEIDRYFNPVQEWRW